MSQMLALFEWDESLGPRWMNQDNLETLLYSSDEANENDFKVVATQYGDANAKERVIFELTCLKARTADLRVYIDSAIGEGQKFLLHMQLQHMSAYEYVLTQRIDSWA